VRPIPSYVSSRTPTRTWWSSTSGGPRPTHGPDPHLATDIGIVLLPQYLEEEYALRLRADGSASIGYLLKNRVLDLADLADAVRRVGEGGSAIAPVVIDTVLRRRHAEGPLRRLTPSVARVKFGD